MRTQSKRMISSAQKPKYDKVYWKKTKKGGIPYKERKKAKKILKTLTPLGKKAYTFYKRNRKGKEEEMLEKYTDLNKVIRSIYKSVSELMVEYEGGVFLQDYGYFANMINPYMTPKMTMETIRETFLHTDGYYYKFQLFTSISRKSCLRGMFMDDGFTDGKTRPKLFKEIHKGLRPKLYITPLNSMYGTNKNRYVIL